MGYNCLSLSEHYAGGMYVPSGCIPDGTWLYRKLSIVKESETGVWVAEVSQETYIWDTCSSSFVKAAEPLWNIGPEDENNRATFVPSGYTPDGKRLFRKFFVTHEEETGVWVGEISSETYFWNPEKGKFELADQDFWNIGPGENEPDNPPEEPHDEPCHHHHHGECPGFFHSDGTPNIQVIETKKSAIIATPSGKARFKISKIKCASSGVFKIIAENLCSCPPEIVAEKETEYGLLAEKFYEDMIRRYSDVIRLEVGEIQGIEVIENEISYKKCNCCKFCKFSCYKKESSDIPPEIGSPYAPQWYTTDNPTSPNSEEEENSCILKCKNPEVLRLKESYIRFGINCEDLNMNEYPSVSPFGICKFFQAKV